MDKSEENNILNYSFDALDIDERILRGIYAYGFEKPSSIQYKSIPIINKKRDVIAQAQSGTGKTGAYSIGLLNNIDPLKKEIQALVILPTYELVHQTFDVLSELSNYLNIDIAKVIGKTSIRECKEGLSKNPQVVVGTPGRIVDMIQQRYLYTDKMKMVVLDEADEILSEGFQDTIYEIIRTMPKETQMCFFSATAPESVLEITRQFMNNPEKILVKNEELTLEGIKQFYIDSKQNHWKLDILLDIYNTISITQCIIYVNTKNILMNIYEKLVEGGYPCTYIHGELTKEERTSNMNDFKSGNTRIMISTDLLSRGIDIQQLSLVINYDIPRQKETYIHRIGRSGRFGRKGVAINFVTDRDAELLKEIERFYNTTIDEMPQNFEEFLI
jgi:translation initiation factor 4A